MKKIFLVLAAMFCVATVSAQSQWAAGLRIGSGLQAQGEWAYSDNCYVEARFGMQYVNGLSADFTVLHNWNCFNMDWTPSAGQWFFDAGVGVNVGGKAHYAYVGAAGQAKLGIKFNAAPVRLSLDWTPSIGPAFIYLPGEGSYPHFNKWGLCNLGVSATYCF